MHLSELSRDPRTKKGEPELGQQYSDFHDGGGDKVAPHNSDPSQNESKSYSNWFMELSRNPHRD
jgi:hypothetical protein